MTIRYNNIAYLSLRLSNYMTIIIYFATHTVDRELATADSRYTSARSGRVHKLIRGITSSGM